MKYFAALVFAILLSLPASANSLQQREGWVVTSTQHPYSAMYDRLKAAIKANKMGHITTASASLGAKGAGIIIPGNRIVGVYNNVWARRMLSASKAAGIEAPIRFYITENRDGSATLSYKKPSTVFAPYFDDPDAEDLKVMASELDVVFAAIHKQAIAEN